MSSIFPCTVFLLLISLVFIEGTSLHENSSAALKVPSVGGKKNTCQWPGRFLLSKRPDLEDVATLKEWQKKVQPQAFRDWMKCKSPVSKVVLARRLRQLKKVFENSGAVEELETRSNCDKSEFTALFEMSSNASQIRRAATCFEKGIERPVSGFSVTVRVDEDCERNKRNMIRRTRNIFIAAVAATAGATACCLAYTPLGPACCATIPALGAADLAALAELNSAINFECPKCSDEPTARLITGQGEYRDPNHYRTDGGYGDWHGDTRRI